MQIIWRFLGQRPRLDAFEYEPLSPTVEQGPRPGDRRDRYERLVSYETPGEPDPDGPCERLAEAIRSYSIFPPQLVGGILRRAPVQAGDTYGICCHFLPGIDLFFAGRVIDSFAGRDGDVWRAGFTFRTVRGHPELGEETFWVVKDLVTGAVRVGMQSWSRPGTRLTRLASPFLRWYQVRATYTALRHLARIAAGMRIKTMA